MPTVYIINQGAGHDYTPAKEFGTLEYLSEGLFRRTNTGKMHRAFVEKLKYSGPDDYILLTSLTVMCCIACGIFASMHNRLNLLIYQEGKYVERKIKFRKRPEPES